MLRALPLFASAVLLVSTGACDRAAEQTSASPPAAVSGAAVAPAIPHPSAAPLRDGAMQPSRGVPARLPARPAAVTSVRRTYSSPGTRFDRHDRDVAGDGEQTRFRTGGGERPGGFVHQVERGARYGLAPGEQIDRIELRSPAPIAQPAQGYDPDLPYGGGDFANGPGDAGAFGPSQDSDGNRSWRRNGGRGRRLGPATTGDDRADAYSGGPYRP